MKNWFDRDGSALDKFLTSRWNKMSKEEKDLSQEWSKKLGEVENSDFEIWARKVFSLSEDQIEECKRMMKLQAFE